MEIMQYFKTILLIQLFFGFAITLTTHLLPPDTLDTIDSYSELATGVDLESTGEEIKDSLNKQTNIPVIDVGSLVFYSGNFIIDLMLNFAFAVPQMIGLLFSGFAGLVNMDVGVASIVERFIYMSCIVLYFVSLIQLLASIRSGKVIT